MSKVEKQSKARRIYEALLKHNGKQVGGDYSNRIEIDVSVLLELFALEDYIKELENKISEQELIIVNLDMQIKHPKANRKEGKKCIKEGRIYNPYEKK